MHKERQELTAIPLCFLLCITRDSESVLGSRPAVSAALARKGAYVVMLARSLDKLQAAKTEFDAQAKGGHSQGGVWVRPR
jgi:hypothetical protein